MGRLRCDEGQIVPLFAAGMAVVVLALTAFVLDVGKAMLAKRELQAQVDAAALAGAQLLPDPASATATATSYIGVNPARTVQGVATTVTTHCLTGSNASPGCSPTRPDALKVTIEASVPTSFAQLVGIDSLPVSASATAAREGSTAPLDIALVLDHTGSMVSQMANLQTGAKAFLDALDPASDRVALVVLPPLTPGNPCTRPSGQTPHCDYYPYGDGGYVVDRLTGDFARLKADVAGLSAAGSTAYEQALIAAHSERPGRAPGSPEGDLLRDGRRCEHRPRLVLRPAGQLAPARLRRRLDRHRPAGGGALLRGAAPLRLRRRLRSLDRLRHDDLHRRLPPQRRPDLLRGPAHGPGRRCRLPDDGVAARDRRVGHHCRFGRPADRLGDRGEYFAQEDGSQLGDTFEQVASVLSSASSSRTGASDR